MFNSIERLWAMVKKKLKLRIQALIREIENTDQLQGLVRSLLDELDHESCQRYETSNRADLQWWAVKRLVNEGQ